MPQSMSIWQNEAVAYLGIDLGTSGLRALLVGADGNPIGAAEQQYPTLNPHPGCPKTPKPQNPQNPKTPKPLFNYYGKWTLVK